jgi:hypothetical protein
VKHGRLTGVLIVSLMVAAPHAEARVEINLLGYPMPAPRFATLAREVAHRTSIELAAEPATQPGLAADDSVGGARPEALAEPWLWVPDVKTVTGQDGRMRADLLLWLRRGGFLIVEAATPDAALTQLTASLGAAGENPAGWQAIPPDHELMRSFYLLDALPSCGGQVWRGFHFDGRLAVLVVPYGFLATLRDGGAGAPCANPPDSERSVRIFVNLIMVALATDYKKDQIHLPEILKRLR